MNDAQTISDLGATGKYFHQMLNIADDDLNPYEYRLLGHYKCVCGYHNKPCKESSADTAAICRMSLGMVSQTRKALAEKGWIIAIRNKVNGMDVGYTVTVIDRMSENVKRCSDKASRFHVVKAEGGEQPESGVHDMNAVSSGESGTHHMKHIKNKEIQEPQNNYKDRTDTKVSVDETADAAIVVNEPAISQSDPSQHSDSALMMNGEASSDAEQSQSDITTPAVALEQTSPAAPAEEKKSKGKKAKKEKAADPDAAAIAALINAWKVESKVIDPAAFGKKAYRDCAREMIALGITVDHVKGCTADLKAEDYWSGRALPFTTVAQNVVVWAEENTLSEHPDSLPIYEIKPNDEYPAGLPYGIKPDDPRAAIYRFDPTAADDPTVLEMTSSLWSDERDFYAKHDIPSPDATGQHSTVKSQP